MLVASNSLRNEGLKLTQKLSELYCRSSISKYLVMKFSVVSYFFSTKVSNKVDLDLMFVWRKKINSCDFNSDLTLQNAPKKRLSIAKSYGTGMGGMVGRKSTLPDRSQQRTQIPRGAKNCGSSTTYFFNFRWYHKLLLGSIY